MSLNDLESLLPTGGLELIDYSCSKRSPTRESEVRTFLTVLVNHPSNPSHFIPLSQHGVNIPPSQTEGFVGEVNVYVSPHEREISITGLYPFGNKTYQPLQPWLMGKGLATEVHRLLIQDLLTTYGPDYNVVAVNPTSQGQHHLDGLNIKGNTPYCITDYLQRIVDSLSSRSRR